MTVPTVPLWSLGLADAAAAYAAGEATPERVLAATLERHAAVNGRINAFAYLDRESAMAQAERSMRRWQAGVPLGPLDGAIVAIKDNIPVAGMPCTWGSSLYRDFIPTEEEPAVARLRAAGAILLGKTTCSELTTGRTNVDTPLYGTTRNPWNTALSPGASSGGSAAALAAGMCMASLGTDGGGSIRRPASHCGVLGLKPSIGRVPRYNSLPDILNGYEVLGPLTRSVADLRILLRAIAGPDPRDPRSWPFAAAGGDVVSPHQPRRVLHVARISGQPVDEPVAASFAATAAWLAGLGCSVTPGELPLDMEMFARHWPAIGESGVARVVPAARRSEISPHLQAIAGRGAKRTGPEYADALAAFAHLGRQMGTVFERFDIVATPSVGAVAGPAGENGPAHERAFSTFVNALGLPAISIPARPTVTNMPVGLQLIGRFGSEPLLLDLAQEIEAQHPWPRFAVEALR